MNPSISYYTSLIDANILSDLYCPKTFFDNHFDWNTYWSDGLIASLIILLNHQNELTSFNSADSPSLWFTPNIKLMTYLSDPPKGMRWCCSSKFLMPTNKSSVYQLHYFWNIPNLFSIAFDNLIVLLLDDVGIPFPRLVDWLYPPTLSNPYQLILV